MEKDRKPGQNGKNDKNRVRDFEAYRNSPLWKDRGATDKKEKK